MAERWKPNNGEKYFYVNFRCAVPQSDTWINVDIDEMRWENGNCFKTEKEAEYAANKVKDLLLSLHRGVGTELLAKAGLVELYKDFSSFLKETSQKNNLQDKTTSTQDNQLPKLTIEVFNRLDCPEWAQIAVVNRNGKAYYGGYKDARINCSGGWQGLYDEQGKWKRIGNELFDATDWQNSLVERHPQFPDWAEVGGHVYDDRNGYGKIVSGSVKSCHIVFDGGEGDFVPEAFAELKQARLRPYNAEEMKALVGKMIENDEYCYVVQSYDKNLCAVKMDIGWVYAGYLVKHGCTIDGKPCGCLEHLENGEWVK